METIMIKSKQIAANGIEVLPGKYYGDAGKDLARVYLKGNSGLNVILDISDDVYSLSQY